MNPDTRAVLEAMPGRREVGAEPAVIAARAGRPLWMTNCAIAVLGSVYRGSVEAVAPKKKGPVVYRRTAEGDRLLGGDQQRAAA